MNLTNPLFCIELSYFVVVYLFQTGRSSHPRRADRTALASERGNCAPVMPKAHNDSACKYSEINRIQHRMNLKRRSACRFSLPKRELFSSSSPFGVKTWAFSPRVRAPIRCFSFFFFTASPLLRNFLCIIELWVKGFAENPSHSRPPRRTG